MSKTGRGAALAHPASVLCAACGPGIDLDPAVRPCGDLHALCYPPRPAGLVGLAPLEEAAMSLGATRVPG
jgi:hypothetical protein